MDITSLAGPFVGIGMIIVGLLLEGGHIGSILQFTAFLIVIGGMCGSIMVAYPLHDIIGALKALGTWLKNPPADPHQILADIIDLAQTARKESILALEKSESRSNMSRFQWLFAWLSTARIQTSSEKPLRLRKAS